MIVNKAALNKFWAHAEMILLPLLSHGIWGFHPVLSRYLLLPPYNVPTLSVLVVISFIVFLLAIPRTIYLLRWRALAGKTVWLLGATVALRSVTIMYASRYTLAVYVQLFGLMTPFFVALMSRVFLKEPIPKAFFVCVALSLAGSVLLLIDDFEDFSFVAVDGLGILGIALSIVSAFFLSLYMIFSKLAANHKAPPSQALALQGLCASVIPLFISFVAPTNWAAMLTLGGLEWVILISLGLLFYIGNMINVTVITKAGASFNSFFIGLRLITAIFAGWLLLGEQLSRYWQWIGVGLVLFSTTIFLYMQEREKAKKKRTLTDLALQMLPPPPPEDQPKPARPARGTSETGLLDAASLDSEGEVGGSGEEDTTAEDAGEAGLLKQETGNPELKGRGTKFSLLLNVLDTPEYEKLKDSEVV